MTFERGIFDECICGDVGDHKLIREWSMVSQFYYRIGAHSQNKSITYHVECVTCGSTYANSYVVNLNSRIWSATTSLAIAEEFTITEASLDDYFLLPLSNIKDNQCKIDGSEIIHIAYPPDIVVIDNDIERAFVGKFIQIKDNFDYLIGEPISSLNKQFHAYNVTAFVTIPK